MTARHTRPPFSARPTYVCPTCGKTLPMGGWQNSYDYDDHRAAHARNRARRVAVVEWAALLVLALLGLWMALTGPRRHAWTGRLAVALCVAIFLLTLYLGPAGH